MVWIAFSTGLVVGVFAGILVLGFCQMAAKFDEHQEICLEKPSQCDIWEQPILADHTK
jgi:hypothetical protein